MLLAFGWSTSSVASSWWRRQWTMGQGGPSLSFSTWISASRSECGGSRHSMGVIVAWLKGTKFSTTWAMLSWDA
ncbi:hypothetical protein BC567DRAFT_220906 [Phyllosticta citribraziliensis]